MDKQPVVMSEFDKLMEEEWRIMMKSIEQIFKESSERVRNSLNSLGLRVTKLEVKEKIDNSSQKSFGMLAECANVNVIVDDTGCAKPCAAIFAVFSKDQFVTLETSNSSSENFASFTGLDSSSILHNNNINNKASNNNNNDLLTSNYEVEEIDQVSYMLEDSTCDPISVDSMELHSPLVLSLSIFLAKITSLLHLRIQ